MINLTIKELEELEKQRIQKQRKLEEWCVENNKLMLSSWKRLNDVTDGDLLAIGIIEYSECQLSDAGYFNQTMITQLGKTVITKTYEYNFSDDILDLCYVHNSDLLHQLLKHQLSKSDKERELDSRYHYEKKHGHPPLLPDEELPLKERSYISGPFCDLDKLPAKNQNTKEQN